MEETMGSRIAAKRKELGITQNKLAELLIISNKAVSKWENNLSYPSIDLLPKIADILKCSIDYLIRGDASVILNEKQIELKNKIEDFLNSEYISISAMQRTFIVGFNRAYKIMAKLENMGCVCRNLDNRFSVLEKNKEIACKQLYKELKDDFLQ